MRNGSSHERCGKHRLNIPLRPFDRDEKAAMVDHICAVLIESRYGPYHSYVRYVYASDLPLEFIDVDLDLMPQRPGLPGRRSSVISESESTRDTRCYGIAADACGFAQHLTCPTSLARGSPVSRIDARHDPGRPNMDGCARQELWRRSPP